MGIDAKGFAYGLERGLDYVFWTSLRTGHIKPVLKSALAKDREKIVVATGPTTVAYWGSALRSAVESKLEELGTDYIDVFHLFWLGRQTAWTEGTVEALVRAREEGKVRAIAISIHDRERAGRLAADSPLDLFMLRYNAAHPGAERDVFPHFKKPRPAVVAYTATAWKRLFKRPSGWTGPVMTAGDCYRFCLSSDHVDVVLGGVRSEKELDENLAALEKGALSSEEEGWMRAFGQAVHG
jgi:aryl-alcohol dehydrogenase-like predicted oxidoreductase